MGSTEAKAWTCPDCAGEGEAPRSLLGACLECPTCGGSGELVPFTPGPWVVKGVSGRTLCVTDKDSRYVVDRFELGGRSPGEHLANAHLIAAAPALLASLKELLELSDCDPTEIGGVEKLVKDRARKAVRLAEGRTDGHS